MIRRSDGAIELITDSHLQSVADFLGEPVSRTRANLKLTLGLLRDLGYDLVTANPDATTRLAGPPAPPRPLRINWIDVAHAVEDGLAAVCNERLAGQRVSDQEEVRMIVACIRSLFPDDEG